MEQWGIIRTYIPEYVRRVTEVESDAGKEGKLQGIRKEKYGLERENGREVSSRKVSKVKMLGR